jgi:hypothetical protein
VHRVFLALLILLALPASAQAAFEVRSFSFTPSSLKAGSHADVQIAIGFAPYNGSNPPEHVRDLTLSLPPGVVGNPRATARCSQADFAADECRTDSQVGTTAVKTTIPALLGTSVTADGDVYNVVPSAGEPARLGVVVRPPLGAEKVCSSPRVWRCARATAGWTRSSRDCRRARESPGSQWRCGSSR